MGCACVGGDSGRHVLKDCELESRGGACVRVLAPKGKTKAFERETPFDPAIRAGRREREGRGERKSGLSEQCSASRGVNSVACRFNVDSLSDSVALFFAFAIRILRDA